MFLCGFVWVDKSSESSDRNFGSVEWIWGSTDIKCRLGDHVWCKMAETTGHTTKTTSQLKKKNKNKRKQKTNLLNGDRNCEKVDETDFRWCLGFITKAWRQRLSDKNYGSGDKRKNWGIKRVTKAYMQADERVFSWRRWCENESYNYGAVNQQKSRDKTQ